MVQDELHLPISCMDRQVPERARRISGKSDGPPGRSAITGMSARYCRAGGRTAIHLSDAGEGIRRRITGRNTTAFASSSNSPVDAPILRPIPEQSQSRMQARIRNMRAQLDQERPPRIVPLELTLGEADAIVRFAGTIAPAALQPPLRQGRCLAYHLRRRSAHVDASPIAPRSCIPAGRDVCLRGAAGHVSRLRHLPRDD